MTKWQEFCEKTFGGNDPGIVPIKEFNHDRTKFRMKSNSKQQEQQKSLDIITAIAAAVLWILLFCLAFFAAKLGPGEWITLTVVTVLLSIVDGVYRFRKWKRLRHMFKWQLYLAGISVYGFIALDIAAILQCV